MVCDHVIVRQRSHPCHTTHHESLRRSPLWALCLTAVLLDMSFLWGRTRTKNEKELKTLIDLQSFGCVFKKNVCKYKLEIYNSVYTNHSSSLWWFTKRALNHLPVQTFICFAIKLHSSARCTVLCKTRFSFAYVATKPNDRNKSSCLVKGMLIIKSQDNTFYNMLEPSPKFQ